MNKTPVWKTVRPDLEKMRRGATIDAEALAKRHNLTREQVSSALNHAMQRGDLDASLLRQGYRWRFIGLDGEAIAGAPHAEAAPVVYFEQVRELANGQVLLVSDAGNLYRGIPLD